MAGFYINTILYSSMAEWSVPESESEEEKSMKVSVQLGGLKIPPERLLHLMRVSWPHTYTALSELAKKNAHLLYFEHYINSYKTIVIIPREESVQLPIAASNLLLHMATALSYVKINILLTDYTIWSRDGHVTLCTLFVQTYR